MQNTHRPEQRSQPAGRTAESGTAEYRRASSGRREEGRGLVQSHTANTTHVAAPSCFVTRKRAWGRGCQYAPGSESWSLSAKVTFMVSQVDSNKPTLKSLLVPRRHVQPECFWPKIIRQQLRELPSVPIMSLSQVQF